MREIYRVVSFNNDLSLSSEEFVSGSYDEQILARFKQAIETEAPIRKDLLCRRVVKSFGLGRTGKKLQEHCDAILSSANLKSTQDDSKLVFWREDQDEFSYAVFRIPQDDASKRNADEIPFAEIVAASQEVLSENPGLGQDELIKQVASLFEYKRLGKDVFSSLKSGIDSAAFEHAIQSESRTVETQAVALDESTQKLVGDDESGEHGSSDVELRHDNDSCEEYQDTAEYSEQSELSPDDIDSQTVPIIPPDDLSEMAVGDTSEVVPSVDPSPDDINVPSIPPDMPQSAQKAVQITDGSSSDSKGWFKQASPLVKILCVVVLVLVIGFGCSTCSQCFSKPDSQAEVQVPKETSDDATPVEPKNYTDLTVGQVAEFDDYSITVTDVRSDGGTLKVSYVLIAKNEMSCSPNYLSATDKSGNTVSAVTSSLTLAQTVKAGSSLSVSSEFGDNECSHVCWKKDTDTASWKFTATPKKDAGAVAGQLKVHYLNVGQGDSCFIELPDGKTMLIDGGPSDAGATVSSYITGLGYSRIDYLIATHPEADHIGGLVSVIPAFEIGEIWAPKATNTTQTYEAFLDAISSKGMTINSAVAGKQIVAGSGCTVDVLSPKSGISPSDSNNWSVVTKLTFGTNTFLFTGDANASLLNNLNVGHIDVLKVSHHGSDTGTSFVLVSALTPKYSVISVGAGNTYGHPTTNTLSILSSTTIYRTDIDGTITAVSDGTTITFSTSASEQAAAQAAADQAAADEAAAAAAAAAAVASPDTGGGDGSITVYKTNTGKKYHNEGCNSLSKSKIPISLEDAKAEGLEPCKKCNPPS